MGQPAQPPPFTVIPPAGAPSPVVVHIPHSATALPDDVRAQLLLTDAELAEELRLMTDHHTAGLASDVGRHGATRMVNGWSRLAVDPERFLDPDVEEMEAVGMGAVYTRTSQGRPLRELSPEHRTDLLTRHFHPYHATLTNLVAARIEQHGHCVLLDLHSYPTRALPYELHGAGPRPEMDIGTDAGHTPGWLRDRIAGAVTDAGFGFAENTPFAGAFVPTHHLGDPRVSSVMLEIRRDTYLDEDTARPHVGAARVRDLVTDCVARCQRRGT